MKFNKSILLPTLMTGVLGFSLAGCSTHRVFVQPDLKEKPSILNSSVQKLDDKQKEQVLDYVMNYVFEEEFMKYKNDNSDVFSTFNKGDYKLKYSLSKKRDTKKDTCLSYHQETKTGVDKYTYKEKRRITHLDVCYEVKGNQIVYTDKTKNDLNSFNKNISYIGTYFVDFANIFNTKLAEPYNQALANPQYLKYIALKQKNNTSGQVDSIINSMTEKFIMNSIQ